MKLLIIGGSGLISGHIARMAMQAGHEVWAVTRGQRKVDEGVHALVADRRDVPGLRAALESARKKDSRSRAPEGADEMALAKAKILEAYRM